MSEAASPDGEGHDPWYGWNPYEAGRSDDPFPLLNSLRENHPVHKTPENYWRVFRHADVVRCLKDIKVGVRTTEGKLIGINEAEFGERRFMLEQDPPNHTRLRRIVSRGFTPPAIAKMRVDVQALVDDLLDKVQEQGSLDVIGDLALPVPSTVICQMMRVPLEDRDKFTEWTSLATHLLAPRLLTEAKRAKCVEGIMSLANYMIALIEERRKDMGDDLISVCIEGEEGDKLSTEELVVQCCGLLVAGFETTIGLIGNGVRALLMHPDQLAKLKADPTLIENTVEECLRFDGPIPATRRVFHEDAEVGGHLIEKNTLVNVSLAAAHRDPRVFDDPDRFDITRDPQNILAFGGGIHYCLGAHLARLETQVAIGSLVQRFDKLELQSDKPAWGKSLFRVLGELPVNF